MEPYKLSIHFDNNQGQHKIDSDSLVVFVEAYKNIAKNLGLSAEIQIGVPEEGGWKTNLIIAFNLLKMADPPLALITGDTLDGWAKKGHPKVIQYINDFITQTAENAPDEIPKACIKGKNKIYEQFHKDRCIDVFYLGDHPLILRNNFPRYIQKLEEENSLYLGETDIIVYSPDWKRKRTWLGYIEHIDKDCSFDFDENLTSKFWEKVKLDKLLLHTTDIMRVQLAERPTHKVKYLVIRVLSYNGEHIDSPFSEEEISKFLTVNTQNIVEEQPEQLSLLSSETKRP